MKHVTTAFIVTTSSVLTLLCTVLFPLGQIQTARADVTWTGDVDPTDPTTWGSNTTGYIGRTDDGTLDITNGGVVNNGSSYIGHEPSSTGVVTVDGTGSMWTNRRSLYVGHNGSGTLNITNGGAMTVAGKDL